jgi:DNA-directed RNA polymerase
VLGSEGQAILGLPLSALLLDTFSLSFGALSTWVFRRVVSLVLQEYWESYYAGLHMKDGKKYVKLEFAPLPKRGAFDLEKIKESIYFFD